MDHEIVHSLGFQIASKFEEKDIDNYLGSTDVGNYLRSEDFADRGQVALADDPMKEEERVKNKEDPVEREDFAFSDSSLRAGDESYEHSLEEFIKWTIRAINGNCENQGSTFDFYDGFELSEDATHFKSQIN